MPDEDEYLREVSFCGAFPDSEDAKLDLMDVLPFAGVVVLSGVDVPPPPPTCSYRARHSLASRKRRTGQLLPLHPHLRVRNRPPVHDPIVLYPLQLGLISIGIVVRRREDDLCVVCCVRVL